MIDLKLICLYDSFEVILNELQRRFDEGLISECVVREILYNYDDDLDNFRKKNRLN